MTTLYGLHFQPSLHRGIGSFKALIYRFLEELVRLMFGAIKHDLLKSYFRQSLLYNGIYYLWEHYGMQLHRSDLILSLVK